MKKPVAQIPGRRRLHRTVGEFSSTRWATPERNRRRQEAAPDPAEQIPPQHEQRPPRGGANAVYLGARCGCVGRQVDAKTHPRVSISGKPSPRRPTSGNGSVGQRRPPTWPPSTINWEYNAAMVSLESEERETSGRGNWKGGARGSAMKLLAESPRTPASIFSCFRHVSSSGGRAELRACVSHTASYRTLADGRTQHNAVKRRMGLCSRGSVLQLPRFRGSVTSDTEDYPPPRKLRPPRTCCRARRSTSRFCFQSRRSLSSGEKSSWSDCD